tara:strand:+ start:7176 stop:7739 length:564 start_codon:yes stop_codon:yes gene_type:complete
MTLYDLSAYNLFDWILAGVTIVSIVVSALRGFIREALALTAWGVAIWLAYLYAVDISGYLAPHIHTPSVRLALTVIGVFVVVLLCSALIRVFLIFIIYSSGLGVLDHLLGAIFGLLRGVVIAMLTVILLHTINFDQDSWWKKSVLVPYIDQLIDEVPKHMPKEISRVMNKYIPSLDWSQKRYVSASN